MSLIPFDPDISPATHAYLVVGGPLVGGKVSPLVTLSRPTNLPRNFYREMDGPDAGRVRVLDTRDVVRVIEREREREDDHAGQC